MIFQKGGLVQNLIHNLKYRGREEVGEELGKWLGEKLHQSIDFQNIKYVIPVPLHKKRLKERGYNQVKKFGIEISKKINAEYTDTFLKKNSYNNTQSKREKLKRWQNTAETFELQNTSLLENQHILLVDDIITTGSTIEACINVLKTVQGIKISIAAMAITE